MLKNMTYSYFKCIYWLKYSYSFLWNMENVLALSLILLEFIIFLVKKYTSILLATLLTISIASCVFYTLCSLHKEKSTFLNYAFLAAKMKNPSILNFQALVYKWEQLTFSKKPWLPAAVTGMYILAVPKVKLILLWKNPHFFLAVASD